MSKLYENFMKLKSEDKSKIYLFKSGIFYISLNEDADILSKKFGFKITNLNEEVTKCGFPEKRLDFYLNLFKNNNIEFKIIDSKLGIVDNISDYLNNEKFRGIVKEITTIDFDDISYKEAYSKLKNIANILKNMK